MTWVRMENILKDERGFSLVSALFILVALAVLGVGMVILSGVQARLPVLALRGAQAYQAANAGIEWGSFQAVNSGTCAASTTFTVENYQVTVTCNANPPFTEGGTSYIVYDLVSSAQQGVYGSPEHIYRQLDARVIRP